MTTKSWDENNVSIEKEFAQIDNQIDIQKISSFKINKNLKNVSHFSFQIVEFLKELYLRFQRISLGIDEVNRSINDRIRTISDITDQNKLKASQNLFQQIQTDIKQLLDEIRDTIVGMNDCPETEMQQAMAEMQQDDDLKHWVIYREYENLLDYSRELLRHILEKSRGGN